MRAFFPAILGMLAVTVASTGTGNATEASPVYSVTYFEAAAPDIGRVAADVRQFATASRNEVGNIGFDAFEQIDRPSRFAIFEGWQNKATANAPNAAAGTAAFRGKVQPLLVGPFEVRNFTGFSMAAPSAQGDRNAVYVLTFVDVFPPGKNQAAALLTQLAEAGRKLPGNLLFDVLLRVPGIGNHFTLVESWRDRKAFDASLMAASTRDFRQKLTPLEGALYDERLYHVLR
jgi:quinol monooxygenase YgiN